MDDIPADELASTVDAYKAMRDLRLAEQKKVDLMKSQEAQMKARIIAALENRGMTACGGATHTAAVTHKDEPVLEDPEALEAHILETGEFDLLQRRISPTAVRARWDEEQEVPGIGRMEVVNLSLRKNA